MHLFVYMTAPDRDTALRIARSLVRERLAAGANILDGAESVYWWKGAMQEHRESLCILKTTDEAVDALVRRVAELHPYETPCVVALPLTAGFVPFLRWIGEETAPGVQAPAPMPDHTAHV